MDPERFFRPSYVLEAWGTKASKPRIFSKLMVFGPCSLRRQGPNTTLFRNMCGFLALVPQASPKTLGQKTTSGSLWLLAGTHRVELLFAGSLLLSGRRSLNRQQHILGYAAELPGRKSLVFWGRLNNPLLPQIPLEKVGGFASHLFQWVLW